MNQLLRVMILGLLLAGAGCTSSSRTTGDTPADGIARSPIVATGSGACNHPYYPLRQGFEAVYTDSYRDLVGGEPRESRFSWRVIDASGDRATVSVRFDGSLLESSQTVRCRDGALTAESYLDLSSVREGGIQARTTAADGQLMPRDVSVGSEWDQGFTVLMQPRGGSLSNIRELTAKVRMHRKVVAEENVTTPAGTYSALKIEVLTNVDVTIPGLAEGVGGALPGSDFTSTEWWSRGVGLVKSETSMAGGAVATAQLESVTVR